MLSVEKALRNRIVGDAAFVTAAGGPHVYKRNPDLDVVALFEAGAKAVVTYFCGDDGEDINDLAIANEIYQFDVWARKSDEGAAVGEILTNLLKWSSQVPGSGTLPDLIGRFLAAPISAVTVQPEATEANEVLGTLHHKVRQFRVSTYPTPAP